MSILGENLSEEIDEDYFIIIIIIMNKSQETTFFSRARENDFRYETKARKVIVHFKFDALYRYVSIESLLKSGSLKVNRKFVLVGRAVYALPYFLIMKNS